MALTIGELVGYFRLDSTDAERGANNAERAAGDAAQSVLDAARLIERQKLAVKLDADAEEAERKIAAVQADLARLRTMPASAQVEADITAAERNLAQLDNSLARIRTQRARIEVEANTAPAEQEIESFADRMKPKLAAAGAAGGAAIGGALAAAMGSAVNIDAAQAKLEAQLEGSAQYAADMGKIAGELYAQNYGGSLDEVNTALHSVLQSGALFEDATNEQISSVTAKVMSLAQAFDQDVTTSINAVGAMVKNGLAANAEEALDLMTRGLQGSANRFGDFTDTIATSSGTLSQFGLDGATSIGIIEQAMDAGAPSADFFIGALEELAGNAGDSVEVFDSLGLSGTQMAQDLNAGGDRAKNALGMLMEALRGMQDPAARSTALVGLFGEEATAMQGALLAVDPTTATRGLGEFAGAAAEVDAQIGDTAAAKVAKLQRGYEMWSASLVATEGPMGAVAAGVTAFGPAAIGMAGSLSMIGMFIGPLLVKLAALAWSAISTAASFAWSMLQMAGNAAMAVGRVLISLTLWVAQTAAQGALAVARMVATGALYIAQWILMGARALVQAAIMALAWIIGVVTPAASALISMAISAAAYIAHWVVMAAGAMARAAIMAAAWLVAMGPIGWVIAAVVGLVALIIANWDTVKAWTIAAWTAVTEWISQAWANIVSYVQGGVDRARNILEWFGSLPGRFAEWFGGVVRTVLGKIGELLGFIGGLPGRILGALGNLGSLLINAGRDIVTGLWNGIAGMGSWLMGQLMGWIRRVVPGPILQFLGIASPSKFMKNEVGRWIPEGLADGIIANSRVAGDAARALAADVAKKAQTAVRQEVAVDWGTVTEQQWDQLRGMGYKGRAGDSREALYVPADVLDKVAGSGKTVSITINNPQAERASDSIGRSGSTLAAVGPWGDD